MLCKLIEFMHEEVEGAEQYEKMANECDDSSMREMFKELSKTEIEHAEKLSEAVKRLANNGGYNSKDMVKVIDDMADRAAIKAKKVQDRL